MPWPLRGLTLSVLILPALAAPAAAAPAPLTLSPCQLEHPLRVSALGAECGVLTVAENPQAPAGRQIRLRIARVAAISSAHAGDPLFILAGGPGASAVSFYVSVAEAFARIHRDRDIVLVDQRGTGASNLLDCPQDEETLERATEEEIATSTRRCLAQLAGRADLRYYTTSLAVADLEQVRAALGYERINLYGASYGTRVAQQYLRRFPGRVRSVILDGVVPVEEALGPRMALDAERALDEILARCARTPPCHEAFGAPAADYQSVRAALAAHAVQVSIPDPTSGARVGFRFGTTQLGAVLRLMSYTADYAALLPLVLHQAAAQHDYGPLAAQFLLATRSFGETVATGMHNSVVCAEDVPFWDAAAIDRTRLAATYIGTAQLDGLATVCRIWPRGPADADLHSPLRSEVPALLLAGSADPATPPDFARRAAAAFTHAVSIELEGFGHGLLTAPCMDRVMADFVASADPVALDTRCTRAAVPLAFFTSVNGPAP
jgi:pimeloyl-ACP methyl ester carboxylesterase